MICPVIHLTELLNCLVEQLSDIGNLSQITLDSRGIRSIQ